MSSDDKIIKFPGKKNLGAPTFTNMIPPNPEGLPQILYTIRVVDKVTGGENVYVRRGHLVVTASNIVLFDRNQEMTWGIPNDDAVISFERVEGPEELDSIEDLYDLSEEEETTATEGEPSSLPPTTSP